jgi:cupin 2 domain-containing protein
MTPLPHGQLLAQLPPPGPTEAFDRLLTRPGLRIERIVSHGHASPPDFWYDQPEDEWVLLLAGSASIGFEDGREMHLGPGDWLTLPAHCRHRVLRSASPTVWVAIFAGSGA